MKEFLRLFQGIAFGRIGKGGFSANVGLGSILFFRKLLQFFVGAVLLVAGAFSVAQAQQVPGTNDPTFNTLDKVAGGGFNNFYVSSIAAQTDGKTVVGGDFTSFSGITRNRIARFNADGSLDASYNTGAGFDNSVHAIALQSDGKAVVVGNFTTYNGTARNRIARLNADGTLDESFNPGAGFNDYVQVITLQSDGKMVVGGDFTNYDGTAQYRIARLNADGSLDTSLRPIPAFAGPVHSIIQQNDGKLVVGGVRSYLSIPSNGIFRLNANGSLDTSFNAATGDDNYISSFILQPDGKLLVKGSFTAINGVEHNGIARLNADGTLDTSFKAEGIIIRFSSEGVNTISLQEDGKLVVGGKFTSYNGVSRYQIIRLNADGSHDASFGTGTSFNGSVYAVALQPDGKVVVGGRFTAVDGVVRNRIARLNPNGSLDSSMNPRTGFDESVSCIALQSDGKIIVGGYFTTFNDTARNRIARLNPDGSVDATFNTGREFEGVEFFTIALQRDGKVIVGGNSNPVNGTFSKRIARLNADGSIDASFKPGPNIYGTGFDDKVSSIVVQDDGKIVVVGNFYSYNNRMSNRIIRLNPDGSPDASFNSGTGFDNDISSLALQSDGKMVVVGNFHTYNNTSCNKIVRLNPDGSLDTSYSRGAFNGRVSAVVLQQDGKAVVGGWFSAFNGIARNRIARLNTDGSLDTSFNPGTGFDGTGALAIALQSDGKVVVGGDFTKFNGTARTRIARLNTDGSVDETFDPGTSFNNTVIAIALQNNNRAIVGGFFTSFNNTIRNRIARLHGGEAISLSTGKEQLTELDVLLYPNPAQGDINLEFSGAEALVGGAKLTLHDVMGRQVLTKDVSAAEAQAGIKLTTGTLADGVYFLGIYSKDKAITKRLVLAR